MILFGVPRRRGLPASSMGDPMKDAKNPRSMSEIPATDLLGRTLTPAERELCDLYLRLKKLSSDPALTPCALMNARQAMVMLWNACVDLDLVFEEPAVD